MSAFDRLSRCAEQFGGSAITIGAVCTTAESCTGGLIATAITDIAGSSDWFDRSFVTYSNEAKQAMLGVKLETLERFGAVSEEVACEMAEGAIGNSLASVSVAVSGIAGPSGGSADKPVGLVCFAWGQREPQLTWSASKQFDGNRRQIREQAAEFALKGLTAVVENRISELIGS